MGIHTLSEMLVIQNKGQAIASTNYWDSPQAKEGFFFLSWNAGAARLLVPDSQKAQIREMRSARYVIISRGPCNMEDGGEGLELLFEDHSDSPYCIQMMAEQSDRLIQEQDQGGDLCLSVWTRGGMKCRFPAKYRRVQSIPCLEPWLSH